MKQRTLAPLFLLVAWLMSACGGAAVRETTPPPNLPSPNVDAYRANAPPIEGAIAKEDIRRAIRAQITDVAHCFSMAIEQRNIDAPRPQGWVLVRFVIDREGQVPALDVVRTFDERTGECVANYMRRWRFPPPHIPGDVYVVYPFELRNP